MYDSAFGIYVIVEPGRTAHSRSVDEVHKKWEKYVLYGRAVCAIKSSWSYFIACASRVFKHARKTQQGSVIHDPFLHYFEKNLFL